MFRRIGLFMLTNILIIATISIITSLLGVNRYMDANGIDYQSLFVFCMVWGMTGSLISLAMSRWTAKKLMGVQVIDPMNAGGYADLVQVVHDISRRAALPAMPEVGIFNSPELNAFATGPTKSRALVAVSTGLLSAMNRDELEGVLGHEISHIKNGDMVTMALLQGVLNAFIMFVARIVAYAVSQQVKAESRYMVRFFVTFLLEIVIGIFAMFVVNWFSRRREFRADAGSAKLMGKNDMIAALQVLKRREEIRDPQLNQQSMNPFKISGQPRKRSTIFASHPPLEDRIAALQQYA